jgi:glycosyl-4,4'-diaponeurosporenoate acyltransferase
VRLVEWSNPTTLAVDIVAWGVVHASTGYIAHRIPTARLDHDSWLTRPRRWERGGRVYDAIRVRRWKDSLPEAGAVFAGGVSKRSLVTRTTAGLEAFATETRRAEIGHWLAAAASPAFALWNAPAVAAVMVAYGVGINLPFIAIQRFNRARIASALHRNADRRNGVGRPIR